MMSIIFWQRMCVQRVKYQKIRVKLAGEIRFWKTLYAKEFIDGSIGDSHNLIHENDTITFVFWKDSFGVYWTDWSGQRLQEGNCLVLLMQWISAF